MHYYESITGQGKSTSVIGSVVNSTERFIFAVPSVELSFHTYDRLTGANVENVLCINNTNSIDVLSAFKNAINSDQRIIIITHQTLTNWVNDHACDLSTVSRYNLIIDEKVNVFDHFTVSFNTIEMADIFKKAVAFTHQSDRSSVFPSSIAQQLASEEALSDALKRFFDAVMNKNVAVECLPEVSRVITTGSASSLIDNRFTFLMTWKKDVLDAFKNVTFLSSLFSRTATYAVLKAQGHSLTKKTVKNEAEHHTNGHRLNIKYFTDKRYTSAMRHAIDEGLNKSHKMFKASMTHLSGDFIYHVNTDDRAHADKEAANGQLLTSLHGLNTYQHLNDAVFLSSLNLSKHEASVLGLYGFTYDQLAFERNVLEAYQFISRTSIRDASSSDHVTVVVPSFETASFILVMFPGATVTKIGATEKIKQRRTGSDKKFITRMNKLMADGGVMKQKQQDRYDALMCA